MHPEGHGAYQSYNGSAGGSALQAIEERRTQFQQTAKVIIKKSQKINKLLSVAMSVFLARRTNVDVRNPDNRRGQLYLFIVAFVLLFHSGTGICLSN